MSQQLMAIDIATLYYRAFHALPSSMRAPDGTSVNAVRGTLDFVAALVSRYSPDVVVAAWDESWRPSWRVEMMSGYKLDRVLAGTANDEDIPTDLAPQIPLVRQALSLLGIQVIGVADQEADDVLGALARNWVGPVLVVSGDRDLFQLVDDDRKVSVVYTGGGMKKLADVNDAWLAEKYGIGPGQYRDFAALRGDVSDGLSGVAGVGDKTGAKLLADFGDIAGIIAAAEDDTTALTPRLRASLLAAREYLLIVGDVIAVGERISDVAVAEAGAPDVAGFEAFAHHWGLGASAERALSAVNAIGR